MLPEAIHVAPPPTRRPWSSPPVPSLEPSPPRSFTTPRQNFLELTKRDAGQGFKASKFHRVIPSFMCQVCALSPHGPQGDDFTRGNRTSSILTLTYGIMLPGDYSPLL